MICHTAAPYLSYHPSPVYFFYILSAFATKFMREQIIADFDFIFIPIRTQQEFLFVLFFSLLFFSIYFIFFFFFCYCSEGQGRRGFPGGHIFCV